MDHGEIEHVSTVPLDSLDPQLCNTSTVGRLDLKEKAATTNGREVPTFIESEEAPEARMKVEQRLY